MRVSDKVRAGPRGSGRVRVVEFSLKLYKTDEPIEMLLGQTHVVPGLQRLAVAKVNARNKALTFDSQS